MLLNSKLYVDTTVGNQFKVKSRSSTQILGLSTVRHSILTPPLDGLSNLLLNSKLYVDTTVGNQFKVKSQSSTQILGLSTVRHSILTPPPRTYCRFRCSSYKYIGKHTLENRPGQKILLTTVRHSGVGFRVVDSTQNRHYDALRVLLCRPLGASHG